MGKVAFLFPGQGSQFVGMGREVFEASSAARHHFETADRVLGFSLSELCFEGPDDALRLTENTQPALLAVSTATLRAFQERFGDLTFDCAAGHSLGEYSAHVAAGTLEFEDALRLVRMRGQFMQQAVPVGAGAMAAILGGERESLEHICSETPGVVEPVNYNSPGQIVIAGEAQAVAAAGEALKKAGSKVIPLAVSAPFHSSMMKPAEEKLRPHLEKAVFQNAKVPVYINVDAAPLVDASTARAGLIRQVSKPVRWEESIRRMVADGVTLFVEVGAGKVLTGLVGRIEKSVQKISVQSPADFDAAFEAIKAC